jgi:hypothetical protein
MKKLAFPLFIGWAAVCLLPIPLIGCVRDSKGINADTSGNGFAIYLVVNPTLVQAYATQDTDLSDLELQEEPWLSLKDIDYYDFSSHHIYLRETTDVFGKGGKRSFAEPFVVVVDGERCYLGYFLSTASSFLPRGPYIHYPGFLADDVISIENSLLEGETDVRYDPRIREAFAKAGKLNLGLEITLNDAKVVNRGEVATMGYSFTITNMSDSPLFVPDPDKMGSGLFHYFTNGLFLTRVDNPRESVWASKKPEIALDPFDKWDINWFTRLDSHESMNRTVVLPGYPGLDSGVYSCQFTYSGPGWISRSDRVLNDARIWIGKVGSSTIEISIEN